ncbi:MAG TPA: ATP-dependent helicase HrpB, partial [Vicinamibacterales bacterium]|nr:ATP-dependent helicase HrpB [Vicinamibacterales bacterium]
WTVGREVGWHIRFERNFTTDTRLLVVTEGILTAYLQQDPLLSDIRTIVLDEFHERSVHADLGLALARQAWKARDDLRIVVMSATLDAGPLSAFLDDCPRIEVPGRLHPIQIDYRADQSVAAAAVEMAAATTGNVLCFLPGAGEINRAVNDVRATVGGGADVVPLHGSLSPDEQDAALAESPRRRIILATNIAETSLTVPGVTAVVDTGWHKVARYDEDRGIDSLELERISADAAAQRAGRAGRVAPGRVRRLWSETDRLRPHGEPDVHRVDLSDAVLDILAWGGDPLAFEWFERPATDRLTSALALLEAIGAIQAGRVTAIGERMKRLPLHPRLARMLIEADGARPVALACALLSERRAAPPHPATTTSDLLSAIDDERSLPPHVRDVASRLATDTTSGRDTTALGEEGFRRAIFAGYPDRVARRREPGSPRFLLASGHGAMLGRESGVRDAEFIVAVDVQAARRGGTAEAVIRIASAVERDWLKTTRQVTHEFDPAAARVRAIARESCGAIVVTEQPVAVDPGRAAALLAGVYRARGWSDRDDQLLRRIRFAALPVDPEALIAAATIGRAAMADVDLRAGLDMLPSDGRALSRELDRLAPDMLAVPSGRSTKLRYEEDGAVVAAVKLQELFGLAESPRLGPLRRPVTFELLAPNGRPVQTTSDLRNFWNTTYQEVRKELRARYPRHPWPEDPWTAPPTARAKPRR